LQNQQEQAMSQVLYGSSSFVPMHDGCSVEGLAERARRAGVAFVNGVGAGWHACDLEEWLTGTYRKAVHVATEITPEDGSFEGCPPVQLAQELRSARDSAVSFVRILGKVPARVAFVEDAVSAGLVTPCEVDSQIGWIPVWTPGATLEQLVRTLFVADFLVRPTDYRDVLLVCPECDALQFDVETRIRGRCAFHGARPCSVTRLTPRLGVVRAIRRGVDASR
jgi:hypothetical protein